jgi:hypothetical protein
MLRQAGAPAAPLLSAAQCLLLRALLHLGGSCPAGNNVSITQLMMVASIQHTMSPCEWTLWTSLAAYGRGDTVSAAKAQS